MKKLLTFLFFAALAQTSFATVWQVDNNANSPAQYKNVQDVIDNHAANGDTIMVEGSSSSYGDITINKQLTVIGEGYNDVLGENTVAGIIYIYSSNVSITGFKAIQVRMFASFAPGSQLLNITIERCNTDFLFGGGTTNTFLRLQNIHLRNNFAESAFSFFVAQNVNQDYILFDSLIVENNIFSEPAFWNWGSNIAGANTIILRNNLFINGDNGGNGNSLFYYMYTGTNFHDAILYNNIFYDCNPSGSVNCIFMNNLTYGNGSVINAPFGTGSNDTLPGPVNNNLYSKNPLFVNFTSSQAASFTSDFHVMAGSPCTGAGVGGTDIGIYGGYYPFKMKESPGIPVVDSVNISNSAVPNGSKFYLKFTARASQ